ncbi:MAG: carboxypeptidase-like regulatory domain-containing protein [Myxococcales bacterium]|nr:carboxypeptidase-like regulatory domain-containing protein [Myxococcales bacterium]
MRASVALLLLAGCTGDTETDKTDTSEEQTGDTGGTDGVDPTVEPADTSAFLSGTVTDESGAPMPDVNIRFCNAGGCRVADTDAAGAYTFDEVLVEWHALEMRPPLDSEGLATTYVPVAFATDQTRSVDVVMPRLDAATPLPASTPAWIDAGEGLSLQVAADMLEAPTFEDPATDLAGVRLDETWYPVIDLEGTVVAMWYLSPFEHHAQDGIPARLDNLYELADGQQLEVYVGSYNERRWIPSGTVTAQGKELVGDVSLDYTSTVLLVAPEAPE